jgi:hypothetical protein
MSWLTGWSYRVIITITENSGATLIDHQIGEILLQGNNHKAANYIDFSLFLSDGADLRITKADGITLLPYWVRGWNPTAKTAKLFLKADVLAALSNTVFYLYGGNSGASSLSSYSDTMTKYPDDSDGIVALYRLDDLDGSGQIIDSGPNGLDSYRNDHSLAGSDGGNFAGEDYTFDGDSLLSEEPIGFSKRTLIEHDDVLNLTSSGTVMFWAIHDNPDLPDPLVVKSSGFQEYKSTFRVNCFLNRYRAILGDGSSTFDRAVNTTTIAADTWYHVAMTWDSNFLNLYINGVVGSVPRTVTISTNTEDLGIFINPAHAQGGPRNWHMHGGQIDDVVILDRLISADEVDDAYHRRRHVLLQPTWVFFSLEPFIHDTDLETPITLDVGEFLHESDLNPLISNPNELLSGNYDHDSDFDTLIEIREFSHSTNLEEFISNPNESLSGNYDHDSDIDKIGVFGEYEHDSNISAFTSNPNESLTGSYDHDSDISSIPSASDLEGLFDHDTNYDAFIYFPKESDIIIQVNSKFANEFTVSSKFSDLIEINSKITDNIKVDSEII